MINKKSDFFILLFVSVVTFVVAGFLIDAPLKQGELVGSIYDRIKLATYILFVPIVLYGVYFWIFRLMAKLGWVLKNTKSAWDDFFLRREGVYVIMHLENGDRIGGWYGEKSYVSTHPNSGHIYIEQIWRLDDEGVFEQPIPHSKGMIFRPEDYHYIEFFDTTGEDDGEDTEACGSEEISS